MLLTPDLYHLFRNTAT